jgi:quercetin dioxygenase-like cupin family protein
MGRTYVRPDERDYRENQPPNPDSAVAPGVLRNHQVHGVPVARLRLGLYEPGEELGTCVTLVRVEAGGHNPLHSFSEAEVACVLAGSLTIGGAGPEPPVTLPAGSVFYLDPHEQFWFDAPPDEPAELLVVFGRTPRYFVHER